MASDQGDRHGDEDAGSDDDPFVGLTLDDAFVASAEVREESAEDRVERLQRIDREHRALAADREQQRRAAGKAQRRGTRFRHRSGPTSGRRSWRTLVVLGALVGLFLAVTVFHVGRGSGSRPETIGSAASTLLANIGDTEATVQYQGGQPPPGVEEAKQPLGQPGPHPTGAGSFVFKELQDDGSTPIAFDPCRPIHYVVNTRTAPADGGELLAEAVAKVSAATGLQFILDGPTDEVPVASTADSYRAYYQPERYGERWAPVLVAWSDPAEIPGLDAEVSGLGGAQPVHPSSGLVYVTGGVTLDGPELVELERGPDGRGVVRATLEHELGHLVGLGHVDDPTQLMNPRQELGVDDFAGGDLEGLARLGQGACFPGV